MCILFIFLIYWCKIFLLGVRRVRQLQNNSIYFGYVMTSRVYYTCILPHKFSACIFLLLLTNSWHSKKQSEWHSHTNICHSPCVFQYRTWMVGWSPFCSWYAAARRNSEYMEYQEQIKFRKCMLKFYSEYFIFLSTNAD